MAYPHFYSADGGTCPLIGGIPYMLYVTKAKKFGMTAIMGFLIGLIMVFFGNGYLTW